MVTKRRIAHWILGLFAVSGLATSCTTILGMDTEYYSNPCTDGTIEPEACGLGACHVFLDRDARCVNGLPTACVASSPESSETCKDGIDNNCNGIVDEGCDCESAPPGEPPTQQICYSGSTKHQDVGICSSGKQTCVGGSWEACEGAVLPEPEICDTLDNDCDGAIDEDCDCDDGKQQTCFGGPDDRRDVGECQPGFQECKGGKWGKCDKQIPPALERCNGKDDDCDGLADNTPLCACTSGTTEKCFIDDTTPNEQGECAAGTRTCENGGWGDCIGAVGPESETCNGKDDDCNGKIDDGVPDVGTDCNTGIPGPCSQGKYACNLEKGVLECVSTYQKIAEVCNGLDDDCNGFADDIQPTDDCLLSDKKGECAKGKIHCEMASKVCKQVNIEKPETCDNFDNDCNGLIDENDPGGGTACDTGASGPCASGTNHCTNGQLKCTSNIQPKVELCDGIDNNCDGIVDDGNPGSGGTCNTGLPGPCAAGTMQCQNASLVCKQNVQPNAEFCDNVDNNCDGKIDEGVTTTYYSDVDTDGYGSPIFTIEACSAPNGYVKNALDCDDSKVTVHPGAPELCNLIDDNCNNQVDEAVQNTYYRDFDGDTYGDANNTITACSVPSGYVSNKLDCDDTKPLVKPNGQEICNLTDDDCDGFIDEGVTTTFYQDQDGDTYGNPSFSAQACLQNQPPGYVLNNQDCNDTSPNIRPGAAELCNATDDDCDNQTDEGNPGGGAVCATGNKGICSQGASTCSGGAIICIQKFQPKAEICNGEDDNCDGVNDDGNPGGNVSCSTNLKGACAAGTTLCTGGAIACNQNVQPSAESCDGLDNNCDGVTDEGNPGGGTACPTGKLGVCSAGTTSCTTGQITCTQNVQPSTETCDGKDNDCDGDVDDGNPGGGLACPTGKPGVCSAGTTSCTSGQTACTQNVQPSSEVCDGLDNDCDGQVDEGNPGGGASCTTGKPGVCSAGTNVCSSGALSCAQTTQPSPETCDGLDNNCNGIVDEGNPDGGASCTTGKSGVCAAGTKVCTSGALSCEQTTQPSTETCDGLDNDCDGVADEGNPGGGVSCATNQPGVCAAGTQNCTGGTPVCSPNVQPSTETCDGEDNDCDGQTDENVKNTYYADADNDAHGDPNTTTLACSPPLGYVANDLDCDDAVNTTYPGASELCDGVDNDCNGDVDEGHESASTYGPYYRDLDGDDYGNPSDSINACLAPPGYVSNKTDCDDSKSGIHPGAAETCGDNIDSDCDGFTGAIVTGVDFSTNPGWSTSGNWEIKAADAGATCSDPKDDHTPNNTDGKMAGTSIGSNASCITSANSSAGQLTTTAIDTSAKSQVYLQFWRWLTTSSTMPCKVEASADGATWTAVWTSGTSAFADAAWTKQSFNISTSKSATMKVRWTYSNGDTTVGGWNIDDVQIVDDECN